jgi:hypothetical protein
VPRGRVAQVATPVSATGGSTKHLPGTLVRLVGRSTWKVNLRECGKFCPLLPFLVEGKETVIELLVSGYFLSFGTAATSKRLLSGLSTSDTSSNH